MFELYGRYNSAKIFADIADDNAIKQIIFLLNQPFVEGSQIRMMPDVHAGIGCVIGTTMTIQDKICPNLVGVDIGCGMEVVILQESDINLPELDRIIREHIPSGGDKHDKSRGEIESTEITGMAYREISKEFAGLYLGTLGGGNHFIEIDKFPDGRLCLVIHTGSRKIGRKVAEYYQAQAYDQMRRADKQSLKDYASELKAQGLTKEIPALLQARKNEPKPEIHRDIAYVTGYLLDEYLHDMRIVQNYADLNRRLIARDILKYAGLHQADRFSTIHNYIDVEHKILRKGSVSANAGERFIIPLNMRDGALICTGKGNPDWNCSAPHGAGRLLSRHEAKELVTMSEYQEAMKAIYSTSVSPETLDESPMAYKDAGSIIQNIEPTATITDHIMPIYNFKAGRLTPRK